MYPPRRERRSPRLCAPSWARRRSQGPAIDVLLWSVQAFALGTSSSYASFDTLDNRPLLAADKERVVRRLLAKGTGIVKTARMAGVGVSAVQRIKGAIAGV